MRTELKSWREESLQPNQVTLAKSTIEQCRKYKKKTFEVRRNLYMNRSRPRSHRSNELISWRRSLLELPQDTLYLMNCCEQVVALSWILACETLAQMQRMVRRWADCHLPGTGRNMSWLNRRHCPAIAWANAFIYWSASHGVLSRIVARTGQDRTGKAHDTEILGLTSTIEGGWLLGRWDD